MVFLMEAKHSALRIAQDRFARDFTLRYSFIEIYRIIRTVFYVQHLLDFFEVRNKRDVAQSKQNLTITSFSFT